MDSFRVMDGATIGRSIIKMVTGAPPYTQGENLRSGLTCVDPMATNLHHLHVEGIVFELILWHSLVGSGIKEENPYPAFRLDLMTSTHDLVVGVFCHIL